MNDLYEVNVTYHRPSKIEEKTAIVVSEKELQVAIGLQLKRLGKGWKVKKVDRP